MRRGGGVAIYTKDSSVTQVTVEPAFHHELPEYETLWLRVQYNNLHYIFGVVYHPPKPIYCVPDFMNYFYSRIDSYFQNGNDNSVLVVGGDFNQIADNDITCHTGLISLVNQPTRGANILDRLYVSVNLDFNIKILKSSVKSDHKAILISDQYDTVANICKCNKTVMYRQRTPRNNANFLAGVVDADFGDVFNSTELEVSCDKFYLILNSLLDDYFPLKQITISNNDPPFVTPEIKQLLRKKNSLMRANKIEQASAISEKVGRLIARFNSTRLTRVREDPGAMWDEVRRLTGTTRCTSYPANITADILNSHYSTISTDPTYRVPERKLSANTNDQSEYVDEISVFNLLDKLKTTSSGPDGLPFWFLKLAAPVISGPLTHVINLSLSTSTIPKQ